MIDVAIVGGGPAGLATAITAATRGLEVVVFEPRPKGSDKACGEGLMPGGVSRAARLGLAGLQGKRFKGVRYLDSQTRMQAEGFFRDGYGLGVPRTDLSLALWDRAESVGVRIEAHRVRDIQQSDTSVSLDGLESRWVVGADGLHSIVRTQSGLDGSPPEIPRFGIRSHFEVAPWTDFVEVYWTRRAEAYVTPLRDDLVGVAILSEKPGEFDRQLEQFPDLKDRLGKTHTRPLGAGPFSQWASKRVSGRILLVGDAAGFIDPITGEGVQLALAAAERLVTCLVTGEAKSYERAWKQVMRRYQTITRALLMIRRNGLASRSLIPALKWVPGLFDLSLSLLSNSSDTPLPKSSTNRSDA